MARHEGRGMASVNYPIGMNLGGDPSQALIHSNPDGKFTVALSAIALGKGMKQVSRQIAAETLGKEYIVTPPSTPKGNSVGHNVRIYGNRDGTKLTSAPSKPAGRALAVG